MKTNKGSVLLTFLITMLVVAVGGSAYYFGTKKTEAPVISEQEVVDDLLIPVPTPTPTPNPIPNPVPVPITPSITVLSPNGGEKITLGQSYTIKWKTTNFSASDYVYISLKDGSNPCPIPTPTAPAPTGCQDTFTIAKTTNTGSYVWDTNQKMYGPTTGPAPISVSSGSKYKISVLVSASDDTTESASDMSNNVFSISTPESSFLYSDGEAIPNSFYIPWRTAEADFAAPVGNSDAYICKSNNLNAQVVVLVDTPVVSSSCPTGMVGCGGSYKRIAIVCGNKYMIHDMSLSGFPYWGYFDM